MLKVNTSLVRGSEVRAHEELESEMESHSNPLHPHSLCLPPSGSTRYLCCLSFLASSFSSLLAGWLTCARTIKWPSPTPNCPLSLMLTEMMSNRQINSWERKSEWFESDFSYWFNHLRPRRRQGDSCKSPLPKMVGRQFLEEEAEEIIRDNNNSNKHLYNIYYKPCTALSALHVSTRIVGSHWLSPKVPTHFSISQSLCRHLNNTLM